MGLIISIPLGLCGESMAVVVPLPNSYSMQLLSHGMNFFGSYTPKSQGTGTFEPPKEISREAGLSFEPDRKSREIRPVGAASWCWRGEGPRRASWRQREIPASLSVSLCRLA